MWRPLTRNLKALARLLRTGRSGPNSARDRVPLRRRLWLETLEDRTVPAMITVNSLLDTVGGGGLSTLRGAILHANSSPGADTIVFDSSLAGGTILLAEGQLPRITDALTITGPGADRFTIDARGRSRIFETWYNLSFEISGLTLTGGGALIGGAVYNLGTLTLTGCTLHHNTVGNSSGGGIKNDGTLTLIDSTLRDNTAGYGGGIYNFGTLTVFNSNFHNNSAFDDEWGTGGGIFNTGTATVSGSTLTGNSAGYDGGGIFNYRALTVAGSILSGNSAVYGGGIENFGNDGRLTVAGSILSGNSAVYGGAIDNSPSSKLTLVGSTLSGNSAAYGGGIYNSLSYFYANTVAVVGSTLSGNSAEFDGGGIFNDSDGGNLHSISVMVTNSTIVLNRADADGDGDGAGGGIWTSSNSLTTSYNTIVAGNVRGEAGGDQPDDLGGALMPGSAHNLIGDAGSSGGLADGLNGNLVGVPLSDILDPVLRDNGGSTPTHALVAGSAAINAGLNALAVDAAGNPLPFDQRGAGFPRVAGDVVDIGSVEAPAASPNRPPTVSGFTRMGAEDSSLAFSAADFVAHYADPDGDPLASVRIETLPEHGALWLDGTAVSADQAIAAADLGLLTFAPAANFYGQTNFTYAAYDGETYSATPAAVTILLADVNDAPMAAGFIRTGNEDIALVFNAGEFAEYFSDLDGDALAAVRIESLPANGTLRINGEVMSVVWAGQEIAAADLDDLVFVPAPEFHGQTSFTYTAYDGEAHSPTPATVTIVLASINDVPVIGAPRILLVVLKDKPLTFFPGRAITVSDVDVETEQVEVSLGVNHGTLSLGSTTGLSFLVGDGVGDAVLSFQATLANINAALNKLTYQPEAGYSGTETLKITADDLGSGLGRDFSLTATRSVTITVGPKVNSLRDDNFGLTLRNLIDLANSTAGADTIEFQPWLTGTIVLTRRELRLWDDLTITGPGADRLTIDAQGESRIFEIPFARVAISGLTLTGGGDVSQGGAIYNDFGVLTLTGCTLRGNSASSYGGGIYNDRDGTLTLIGCTLSGNSAGYYGGGIYNGHGGVLTVTDSPFSGNSANFGGGIYNEGGNYRDGRGNAMVTGSTLSGNSAAFDGGGIYNGQEGALTVTGSTLSRNSADNAGGGIYNWHYGALTVTNSTLSGNSTGYGGGGGSGIYNVSSGTLSVTNSTIVLNQGDAGIRTEGTAAATLNNTIVVGNTLDLSGAFHPASAHNLIGDITGSSGLRDGENGNLIFHGGFGGWEMETFGLDRELRDNGGSTLTHALLAGSIAINAGSTDLAVYAGGNPLPFDQRGEGFARVMAGPVDLGAYEDQNQAPVGSDFTKEGAEDSALTFAAADFTAHVSDPDGDPLVAVQIATLPNHGTLTFVWGEVVKGHVIGVDDLDTLVFEPEPGFYGETNFTYYAYDGKAYSLTPATATIRFTALNNAPVVSGFTKEGAEDNALAFSAANFTANYADAERDPLVAVRIESLPVGGTLLLGGVEVSARQQIAAADLGLLVFKPAVNFHGQTIFTFTASDGVAFALVPATVTLRILSADEQAQQIEVVIAELVANRVLNQGQGQALKSNLKDNPGDVSKVQAFLSQVQAFIRGGILTEDEAAELLRLGNLLLRTVTMG